MQTAGNNIRDLPEEEANPTFPIVLTRDSAWMLATLITPGPIMDGLGDGMTRSLLTLGRELRHKINRALLNLYDEEDTETVEVRFDENEAWLLDQAVRFDGPEGAGTSILIQLYRGLVGLELGPSLGFEKGMDDFPKGVVKDILLPFINKDKIPDLEKKPKR